MNDHRNPDRGRGSRNFSNHGGGDWEYPEAQYPGQSGRPAYFGNYPARGHQPAAMGNYDKKRGYKKPPRGQRGSAFKRTNSRGGGPNPRSFLNDEDEMMGGQQDGAQGPRKRYSPYSLNRTRGRGRGNLAMDRGDEAVMKRLGLPMARGRGRGRGSRGGGGPRDRPFRAPLSGGPTSWFKVTLPHGKKYDKDYLLGLLTSASSHPFMPRQYRISDDASTFFVQNVEAAQALQTLSGQLTTDKGFKLNVIVRPSSAPLTQDLTPDVLEKLTVILSSRYNPTTKALDLSSLSKEEALHKEGIFITLYQTSVVREVLQIISSHIPELESLDLQHNDLRALAPFSNLHEKAPNMTRLNLGNNQLHIEKLHDIRQLQLLELCLDGNPLCDKFHNEDIYVSTIRKKFPKVIRLDGHDLPPPITFDVEETVELPKSQGSHFGANEEVKSLVGQFIQQYFSLYDGNDRSKLIDAYHEHAIFTLSVYTNEAVVGWQPKLSDYYSVSRNLLKDHHIGNRQKKQTNGRISIVHQLKSLPETEHDLNSFEVDVIHLSTSMLTFSVTGLFKEVLPVDPTKSYTRTFSRVFVTVPQGAGVCIMNEQLTITNPTKSFAQKKFKASLSSSSSTSTTAQALQVSAPGEPSPEQQNEIILRFSSQSGMNADWSGKCLRENSWNYDVAAKMFTDLNAKGAIPPDAFVK